MARTKLFLNLTRLYHKNYNDSPILFVMTSVGSIITVITISWMLILWSLVGMFTPTHSHYHLRRRSDMSHIMWTFSYSLRCLNSNRFFRVDFDELLFPFCPNLTLTFSNFDFSWFSTSQNGKWGWWHRSKTYL